MRKNLIALSIACLVAGLGLVAQAGPADQPKLSKSTAPMKYTLRDINMEHGGSGWIVQFRGGPRLGLGLKPSGFGFVSQPPAIKLII